MIKLFFLFCWMKIEKEETCLKYEVLEIKLVINKFQNQNLKINIKLVINKIKILQKKNCADFYLYSFFLKENSN